MKLLLMVGTLLIYFPVLYFFKTRILKEMNNTELPEHMRWYESSLYLIKTTSDESKKAILVKLHWQIRIIGICGIALFWFILFFYPA